MQFLNKKQEVLDIQLTSYGKTKLMSGDFTPEYCMFFDDEIVYKQLNEKQNEIKGRILENINILCSNTNLKSKEKTIKYDPNFNREYEIGDSNFLGTSRPTTDYIPSFEVKVLKGNIYETNLLPSKTIFNMDENSYKVSVIPPRNNGLRLVNGNSSTELSDGSIIEIEDSYLLFDITEENVENNKDNFEIEILEILDNNINKRLLFNEKQTNIVNNILLDDYDLSNKAKQEDYEPTDVSYFFEVLVDDEIDRYIIEDRTKVINAIVDSYKTNIIPNAPTKDDKC